MKLKRYFFLFACIFVTSLHAQDIPVLPSDPNIQTGTLPNGLTYYLVSNTTCKGKADFALVQKTGTRDEDSLSTGRASEIARNFLARQYLFRTRSPQDFLSSEGVKCGKDGYVKVSEDATVYRFGNLSTVRGENAADSTLLLIFGIIDGRGIHEDDFFGRYYPTDGQAIIVSGDIDRAAYLKKIYQMSLMVPPRISDKPDSVYSWISTDSVSAVVRTDSSAVFSALTLEYRSPRIPREYMPTVLPTVSERLGSSLGIILQKRIGSKLYSKGIPFAGLKYEHVRSSDGPGDEKYSVSMITRPSDVLQASDALAEAIAELASCGAETDEYSDIYNEMVAEKTVSDNRVIVNNSVYVDRCISAFLYNSSLASSSEKLKLLTGKVMPDTTKSRLFNNFASKLLGVDKNVKIIVDGAPAGLSEHEIAGSFMSAWHGVADTLTCRYSVRNEDTLKLVSPEVKSKIKRSRTEHVSGGFDWTFSNGMRVVYKKMRTGGLFHYDFLLRGGYAAMKDIRAGEGAFLSDILKTEDVAGMTAGEFGSLLRSNGIFMDARVDVSRMDLYGTAPSDKLHLLLKSLLSVSYKRESNPAFSDFYESCEELDLSSGNGSLADRMAAIDTILCPGYNYSSYKYPGVLSPDLPGRADKFFTKQFSKANDGVLILVGDMYEETVKKILLKYMGAFITQERAMARRPILYQPISSGTTYTVDGAEPSVDVVMSARIQLSADNYFTAKLAAMVIRETVSEAALKAGMCVIVRDKYILFPQERFNMLISAEPAQIEGLAAGTVRSNVIKVLYIIRSVLDSLAGGEIGPGLLDVCKADLLAEIDSRQADPSYWIEIISKRMSDGKDLNTGYADKIKAVTADDVCRIIDSVNSAGKVEYVVTGENPDGKNKIVK